MLTPTAAQAALDMRAVANPQVELRDGVLALPAGLLSLIHI